MELKRSKTLQDISYEKIQSLFGFNHINENNEHIETLKELYKYYHKLQWCYNRKHKKYKIYSFVIDSISAAIVTISTSTAITINPLISTLSFLSLATNYIKKKKKWDTKSNKYKEVTVICNRILADLRSNLRMEKCDMNKIKEELKVFDKKILDIIEIPNIEKQIKEYWRVHAKL